MRDHATIAAIAPIQPEYFFDLLWQGVWESTFDLASFGVEVQNLTTHRDDVREQHKILELLLDNPPDAIAVMPLHLSALNDLVDEHVRRGTPVITFLEDAPESRRVAFVRPDPRQAGVLGGEVLSKLAGGHGRILSFPGSPDQFQFAERYAGFRDALSSCRRCRLTETSCPAPADTSAALREMLDGAEPVAGCYVGNEDLIAVAQILEDFEDRTGARIPCIGFGNTEPLQPFLQRGVVSAVIDENRYQIGYFAVQKAYEAILKRSAGTPVSSVQIPSTVIFAANAAAPADSLGSAFELLVRQRTETLVSYKERLEEANAKLLDLAVTDPLTGLSNRRKFEETLDQEIVRALRYGPLSLLMADLNFFKQVNDRYGHQAGDDALKAVAQVLKSCCRATDTCARLGGDEFAIILPHSDSAAAAVVRERIQQQIARVSVPTARGSFTLGLSIGAATFNGGGSSRAEALISAADASMYNAKRAAHEKAQQDRALPLDTSAASRQPLAFP